MLFLVLLFYYMETLGFAIEEPLITTKSGIVKGRKFKTRELQHTCYAFQGIPYAEPPLGNLRFSPPVPKNPWTGILNTTSNYSPCIQGRNTIVGSEDCLFIDVYTSTLSSDNIKLLPVMVFIHGGAFVGGHCKYDDSSPDYLLENGVVYACFTYRLGVFGFMTTYDRLIPGNNGLKDQVLALTWIKENIQLFGGDPNQITIFGGSAGGASISYHLQSPKSKNLFQQAIIQSGVSLCPWSRERENKYFIKTLASNLAINTTRPEDFLFQLRQVDVHIIQNEFVKITNELASRKGFFKSLTLGPSIEPHHSAAFFSELNHQNLLNGNFLKIPVIVGHSSMEGAYHITENFRKGLVRYDENPALVVPFSMNISDGKIKNTVGNAIKKHYFANKNMSTSDEIRLMKWMGHDKFNRAIREFINLYYKHAPLYYYIFSYVGSLSAFGNKAVPVGAAHCDDFNYIFAKPNTGTENDILTRKRMVLMWTNFAKYGRPTLETEDENHILFGIDWKTYDGIGSYLSINSELSVKEHPEEDDMNFWTSIWNEYGVPPYDTY